MNLNIRLLILDTDKDHADELSKKIMPVMPFVDYEVSASTQEALEAHLENPFNVSLITSSISEPEANVFLRDMQELYTKSQDKLCAFILILPVLPANFKLENYTQLGYSTAISEKLDEKDQENLKNALDNFTRFKKVNEHIGDVEWTMKMILAEVNRVSSDRKRGRDTKFNKIAISFASDLVEFDARVMERYFDCLTEETEKEKPESTLYVKIPKAVLKKNLPKLVEDRYTGASSRVWQMLKDKFGTKNKTKAD